MKLSVLVACEESGIVRDAFRVQGHDAYSCDTKKRPGKYHITGDVRPYLREPWDIVIAHPPCTYLAAVGWHYVYRYPERLIRQDEGVELFLDCYNANSDHVAVENPVMVGVAREKIGLGNPSQYVQPYEYGDPYTKRTGLWLRGLPLLEPTKIVRSRGALVAGDKDPRKRRRKDGKMRSYESAEANSRFSPGIAKAMAAQWGGYVCRRRRGMTDS